MDKLDKRLDIVLKFVIGAMIVFAVFMVVSVMIPNTKNQWDIIIKQQQERCEWKLSIAPTARDTFDIRTGNQYCEEVFQKGLDNG